MTAPKMTEAEAMVGAFRYMQTNQAKRENEPRGGGHGFERIGDVLGTLGPLAERAGVPLGEAEPSLDDLRWLPETATLAADVQRLKDAVFKASGRTFGLAYRNAQGALKLAEMHHRWGLQRDALRAARPRGCRCLGDGKVIVGDTYTEHRTSSNMTVTGRGRVVEYCPCEDGQAARQINRDARNGELQARADKWLAELFDDTTRAQLGTYVDYTIESFTEALDGYPLDEQRRGHVLAARLRDWTAAPGSPWMFLYGDAGTGKTGLSVGVARIMASLGNRTMWRTADRLLEQIQATYNGDGAETDVLDNFRNVPNLVIDELGVAKASEWAERKLFDILNARYVAKRRTVLVANLDPGEFEDWCGPRIWTRIEQRTNGLQWIVEADGPNLRQQPGLF